MPGPLSDARVVTKLPCQDLGRARAWYASRLGLEPVEERQGGLRYVCGETEFHLFASTGAASGASTQVGFEVADIDATVAFLRERGVILEEIEHPILAVQDGIVTAPDNYPSKGTGERGAFLRDSEGNLIGLGQAI